MAGINCIMEVKNVTIYMASLPRQLHCVLSLQSLAVQPEFQSAVLVCNNYNDEQFQEVQRRLSDIEVQIIRGDNAKGSNEKLRYIGSGDSKYICLADDDLLYRHDFLNYLISGCEKYQAHVSLHGVILAPGQIQSYYRDRQVFRGLGTVAHDTEVDVASNCGSLFKREWFTDLEDWYDRCGSISADDLYVSYFMKKKGIHRYCLKHQEVEGYLKHKVQFASDDYVFDRYKYNDYIQTTFINSFYKKL